MISDTTSTSFDSSDDSLNEESLNNRYAKKREAAKRRKLQLQQRRLSKKGKIPNAVRIGEMTSSSEFESPSEPGESLVHDHVELKETSETSSVNPDSSEVVESTEAITGRKSITRQLGNIFNRVHSFIGNLKKKTPESQKSDPGVSEKTPDEKSDFDECMSLQEADELQVVRSESTDLQELSDELEVGEENENFAKENREKLEEKVTGFSSSLVPAPVTDVTPKETSTQEVNEKKLTLQEYLAGLNGNGNNMETRTLDVELVGDEQFEDGQYQNTPTTSEHLPRVRTFKELNQKFQETASKAKLELSMIEETMRRRREGVVEEKSMVTEVEEDSRISEESFWKVMREAAEEGSISFPLFQEIMKKRRESAEKMKTSEAEPKEEVKTKKTENLEKDTTDYKKKFLNASKHCREAQEEMKLAVNKAERFEKKAKRTDELERKMKEMEKEMQRMNRKLAAQAQQAEEIERLKAKISKKETVEKQLRAEKKEHIRKNQELQLEVYKSKKTLSTPEAAVDFHNLDELQKMKDDFPREELLNEMKEMAEKVQTISNSSDNVKVAEYELIRMEKTINIYLDTLEINIQKIKKTHDNSELLPLPRVPCFSEKFLRIYFDEIDKLPSDAQGIPDTDCLICHVFRESDEKTIQCATCNKVYHLDCAQQWFKTKRTCPHCCEWFKPTKESMVNNNINNCWKL